MALDIYAIEIISLSEINTVQPLTIEQINTNPDDFKRTLFSLGMDCYNYPLTEQHCTHRNRFGNIVTDYRWVCNSRVDKQWVESGYASQAAKDKSLGNSLLIDSYRLRGEVESVG